MALGGPCFFDPLPGDWGSLPVVNDTLVPVRVAYCNGSAVCGRSLDGRLVQPGATAYLSVESCDAGAVGVYREPGAPPIACVTATTQRALQGVPRDDRGRSQFGWFVDGGLTLARSLVT